MNIAILTAMLQYWGEQNIRFHCKRCKFVTNVWYVKNILANCDGNVYLPILHLPRVELHCKLQEKLHRVTGPLVMN